MIAEVETGAKGKAGISPERVKIANLEIELKYWRKRAAALDAVLRRFPVTLRTQAPAFWEAVRKVTGGDERERE
jgi:hypothetical protein